MGERRGPPPLPTEELKRVLVLDAKQAQSVDEIFRKHREQIEQLHQRTREQHESLARDTDERLRKVLSAEQFKTFQEWKAAHRPRPPHAGGPRGGQRPPHRPPHGAMPPDAPSDAPPPAADQRQGG